MTRDVQPLEGKCPYKNSPVTNMDSISITPDQGGDQICQDEKYLAKREA